MENYICPHCGHQFTLSDQYAGTTTACPACGKPVTVPTKASAAVPPPMPGLGGQYQKPPAAETPTLAIVSLVLGILSFVCLGPFLGIPAIITGHLAYSRIKRSQGALGGAGLALAGLIVGYLSCVFFIVVVGIGSAIMLPALSRAREAAIRSSCQNNLKQVGLVLKMFSNEQKDQLFPALSSQPGQLMFDADSVYPEYLTDPMVVACPKHLRENGVNANEDRKALIGDGSYFYLGYAVQSEADVQAYADAYRKHLGSGQPMTEEELPVSDGKTLYRLREGVERFFITDINNPASGALAQSTIPIVIERPYNHIPNGGNVLYLDGHVEFRRFPSDWPMTRETIEALESLDAMQ